MGPHAVRISRSPATTVRVKDHGRIVAEINGALTDEAPGILMETPSYLAAVQSLDLNALEGRLPATTLLMLVGSPTIASKVGIPASNTWCRPTP